MTSNGSQEFIDTIVIGAGPCGLGAVVRFEQVGHTDWVLLDAFDEAGGLACTDVTKEGFLFDMGGHVIFSHWLYFDELLNSACGEDTWNEHQRVSYVWIKGRWVEYPFQNNLYKLDQEDQINCINGVLDATKITKPPTNFDEWILKVMGPGIADIFMRPYNFKVWAYPTVEMSHSWLGERVATVDAKKVIANVLKNSPDAGWGPNALFRFPKEGGTGGIWKNVSKLLPQEKLRFKHRVTHIDVENKVLTYDSPTGTHKISYNKIMSTLPLDTMCDWAGITKNFPPQKTLHYSSTHVVGLGLRGISPHELKCWLYFPEDDCPFYRCTVFSHYAKKNCPDDNEQLPTIRYCEEGKNVEEEKKRPHAGPYWSLMFEISESAKHKPVPAMEKMIQETIQGAINTSLVKGSDEIVSIYHRRLEKGYPTPHIHRDDCLATVLPNLKNDHQIWSRGRFGCWKYEVGNQDHSCILGVEAADNMLFGTKEFTFEYADKANAKKNMDLRYVPPKGKGWEAWGK